jgi:hypothetical protein
MAELALVAAPERGVEPGRAGRGDVEYVVHLPVTARESRCRICSPEDACRGAVPVQEANRFRSANRAVSPTSARIPGRHDGPDAGQVHQRRAAGLDHRLQLGGQVLISFLMASLCVANRGEAVALARELAPCGLR